MPPLLVKLFFGLILAPGVGVYVAWKAHDYRLDLTMMVIGGGAGLAAGLFLTVLDWISERRSGKPTKWE